MPITVPAYIITAETYPGGIRIRRTPRVSHDPVSALVACRHECTGQLKAEFERLLSEALSAAGSVARYPTAELDNYDALLTRLDNTRQSLIDFVTESFQDSALLLQAVKLAANVDGDPPPDTLADARKQMGEAVEMELEALRTASEGKRP